VRGRSIERGCDLFVWASCRDREMASALLEIDIQRREAFVKRAPAVQRQRLVAGRCEKRMRESNPLAVELGHAPSLSEFDVVDAGASQGLQQCHRRRRECRHSGERLPDTRGQGAQPLADDRSQALRQLDVGVLDVTRAVDESPPQLEREERIAPGDVVNAHNHRPRQRNSQPAPQQPMDRADRERRDRQRPERCKGPVELERNRGGLPSHRRENGYRRAVQPSQHEHEHLGRAVVEPVRIVQRDEHWTLLGQRPHQRKQRESEGAGVRKPFIRLPHQQRCLESTPLDRRQPLEHATQSRGKQIAHGREGDLRLRLGRAGPQHPEVAFRCDAQCLLPEHRLPDPGMALHQQRMPAGRHGLEKRLERQQLVAPADDLGSHRSLPARDRALLTPAGVPRLRQSVRTLWTQPMCTAIDVPGETVSRTVSPTLQM
jgi:hypothetical protein